MSSSLLHSYYEQAPRQLQDAATLTALRSRLEPFALQGGLEFSSNTNNNTTTDVEDDDMTTYQSAALQRIATQFADASTMDSLTDAQLVQLYTLQCIYQATNAQPNVLTWVDPRFAPFNEINATLAFPSWILSGGWKSSNTLPCGTNTTAPWYGVTCNEAGQITEISLVNNRLTGSWPAEIQLLASDALNGAGDLQYLEVFDNEFLFNNFDNSWMTNLGPSLGTYVVWLCGCVVVFCSRNRTQWIENDSSSAPIDLTPPIRIRLFLSTEYLFVGATGFAGRFPELPVGVLEVDFGYTLMHKGFDEESVFAFSPLLEYLNLGGNALNTTLPSSLTSLPNLKFLYVNDCFLRGNLTYLSQMPAIYEHWIDGNPDFGGTLPETTWPSTLASFSVTANGLTGTIPTSLNSTNLPDLQQLWLYDNDLTGSLPTELGSLSLLTVLEVGGNSLTGSSTTSTMPTEICDNTGLFGRLATVGADCSVMTCPCCTCCSLQECQPDLYPYTSVPTLAPTPEPQPVAVMPPLSLAFP